MRDVRQARADWQAELFEKSLNFNFSPKTERQFFRNRACPSADHTRCYSTHVSCSVHTVRHTALYTMRCVAVRDVRPACADRQTQFRRIWRSIFREQPEVLFFAKKSNTNIFDIEPAHLQAPLHPNCNRLLASNNASVSAKRLAT